VIIVEDLLGPGVRVVGETSGDGGARAWHVVDADGVPLVVKVAPAGAAPSLARSARAQRAAADAGVPVPRVRDAGTRGEWQHLVYQRVHGRPWREVAPGLGPVDRARVHAELTDVLGRLRGVSFRGFGDLERPAGSAREALADRCRVRIVDAGRRAVAELVLDRHGDLFADDDRAVLVHGDLHHANVLVRPAAHGWTVAAVLDWDSAWAGPADADAARAALWDDMPGEPEPVDVRAAVHQLLWCLEYPAATPRHRADTMRLAALLGVAGEAEAVSPAGSGSPPRPR
jgi:aminoglycoside phosphotransferase (APT) family kinase protein